MIDEEMYKEYFGVSTAPTNLSRLEYLSLNLFQAIPISKPIPLVEDIYYQDFLKALMEQINFLSENPDLLSIVNETGATLGKFSEGNKEKINTNQIQERISPMTYNILLKNGYLYLGLCS